MPSKQDYLDGLCDEKGLPLKAKRGRPKKLKEPENGSTTKSPEQQQSDESDGISNNDPNDRPDDRNRGQWWENNG